MIDISLESLCEYLIVIRHTTHTRECLIDREYLEFPETSREIPHESLRYLSIVDVVWDFFHEFSSRDHLLCFPERSPHADTETLRLIARSDRDLISDEDTLAFELRVSQDFAGCIERVAVDVCKEFCRSMKIHT